MAQLAGIPVNTGACGMQDTGQFFFLSENVIFLKVKHQEIYMKAEYFVR